MIIGNPITLGGGGGGYELPEYAVSFLSHGEFTLSTDNNSKNWDGILEYSTDGKSWTTWDGTGISSRMGFLAIRGTGNTRISGNVGRNWVITGNECICSGNIETLLDWQTVSAGNHPVMANKCFYYLFVGCSNLLSAPELPATDLSESCYELMFNASGIVKAPTLPASTLAADCYKQMFQNCPIITAPELNALTLADSCYYGMFEGCAMLTTAPSLPATTCADSCYFEMFKNCAKLRTPPRLPAITLADGCYTSMFESCSSLSRLMALPAVNLESECYLGMFKDCYSIKIATSSGSPYTRQYKIPSSGTGVDAVYALDEMFENTGGTFKGTPSINTTYYSANIILS